MAATVVVALTRKDRRVGVASSSVVLAVVLAVAVAAGGGVDWAGFHTDQAEVVTTRESSRKIRRRVIMMSEV